MALISSGKEFDKEAHHKKMKDRLEGLEITQYTLRLPKHFYRKVRMKLAENGERLSFVLIQALEEYIKK